VRIPKLLRTSSFRLTVAYAALFSLSALILFVLISSGTSHYLQMELRNSIASDLTELREIFESRGADSVVREIKSRMRQADNADMMYLLQNAAGNFVAGNMPPQTPRVGLYEVAVPARYSPENKARTVDARSVSLSDGGTLFVAADTASLHEMQLVIFHAFVWSFGITLVLAFFGGTLMSRKLLLHVESISQTGRDIMDGNLSLRIPIRGVDDEFDHLATSLNLMLAQTERLVESMRQVSNDIAHDLRTPLTRLRQRLERTQTTEQSIEGLRTTIDRSISETDSILETFSALLRIAQIESATSQQEFALVHLSEALQMVVEIHQPTADERGQHINARIAPDLNVWGDRELLIQMLFNVLGNAIRHSPDQASISLTGEHVGDGIDVVVADNGPGIPEAERSKVFRRFYRLESSRSTPGNGLGLSLVAAVAQGHGVTIHLEDNHPGHNHPGLCVRLHFPKRIVI
jgi:signal transduction histidine kinase